MDSWRVEDCRFEPNSCVDPVGRVFHRDGRVFRAIAAPYGDFMRGLVDRAERHGWSAQGLVPTTLVPADLPGYEAVLEHRRIPFVTLRGEWPFEALREAALCLLRLNAELLRHGACLKDAHPWNVLFEGARPWFVDWGSVRPAAELDWDFWYGEFRRYVLAPLALASLGRPRMARAVLREHVVGLGNELMDRPALRRLPREPARIAAGASSRKLPDVLDDLAAHVAGLELPDPPGEWAAYPQPAFAGVPDAEGLRGKDRLVHQLLASDPGRTVLDLGTNHGLHARIAAALGKRVVACDIEEACLNRLYRATAASGEDILVLHHDFLWPIGESGLLNAIPASTRRLRCDTVLAMAVTHHLALRRGVSLEAIARGIDALAEHRAIVEFVPLEDVHVASWTGVRREGYSLEAFLAAMAPWFGRHRVLASDPAPRVVVAFERGSAP